MPISAQPETGTLDIVGSAGASRTSSVLIADSWGSPVTGWSGSDTLTAQVWPGDDREPLTGTGVTAAWVTAASGALTVTTDGTHTLPPKRYQWRLLATSGGKTYELVRGTYDVIPAPGAATNTADPATAPYTTIDDLRSVASWIETLQGPHDRAGLAEHQEAARRWFDKLVLQGWKNSCGWRWHSPLLYGLTCDPSFPEKWLMDVLATGSGVKITPEIRDACANYACYRACLNTVTVDEKSSSYRAKAGSFKSMADNIVSTMTVWVKSSTTAETYGVPIQVGIGRRN